MMAETSSWDEGWNLLASIPLILPSQRTVDNTDKPDERVA